MYTGIIYKYTSPSGKCYIGQTTQTLKERARYTGDGYKKCTVFYKAILKYGFQNFSKEVLEEIQEENLEQLKKRLDILEEEYIYKFQSLAPNGYNLRLSADHKEFSQESQTKKKGSEHFNWRKDLDEENIKQMYLSGMTLREISEVLDISKETIKRHIEDQGILKEKKYNVPVVKMNKEGKILQEWSSISAAEREENKTSIGRCCREKRRPYKGITYRFKGESL